METCYTDGTLLNSESAECLTIHLQMEWLELWQLLFLKILMVGYGEVVLARTSLILHPRHLPIQYDVIILFKSVPVHQMS